MRYLALILLAITLAAPIQAATVTVYPFGRAEVTVPVNQYINVGGYAKVSKQIGGPASSSVARFTPDTTVTGGMTNGREVVFGPYTIATVIRIETLAGAAYYSVGALAAPLPILRTLQRPAITQLTPAAYTVAQTVLASDMMLGIIVGTPSAGATAAYTLPTGTLMDTASGLQIDQGFSWSLINVAAAAADSITLTAATGHTIVGDAVVISTHVTTGGAITSRGCSSSSWFTRKTAANTFVTYRIR